MMQVKFMLIRGLCFNFKTFIIMNVLKLKYRPLISRFQLLAAENATWFHTSRLGKSKLKKKFANAISAVMVISSVVMIRQLVPKEEYTCLWFFWKQFREVWWQWFRQVFDDHSEDDAQSDMEEKELFSHTEFSNAIDVGKIIAIYSTETVNKPFFLFLKKGKQSNIFLMIMITTFLLVLIIWWSIILKKPLKTFNQELLITRL